MRSDPQLWSRVDAFDVDDPVAEFPFSARLARDNGWSRAFAARVVAEYKRFVYLTQVSRSTLTPSDEVDQAWHLHMTYTRDYWDRLCAEVLGRPLHHGPTRGISEEPMYRGCYDDTRALYAAEFGTAPPADIWPDTDTRFIEAVQFKRINVSRAWVIPRPRWVDGLKAAGGRTVTVALAALALVIGGSSLALAGLEDVSEGEWIALGGLVLFVIAMVQMSRRQSGKGRRGRDGGAGGCGTSGCSSGCSSGCGGGGGCGGD